MILNVQNEKEAIDVSRQLVLMCNDIKLAFITDDIKAQSYENILCRLRDSIQVAQCSDDDAKVSEYSDKRMAGTELIAEERKRQIEKEGFTVEHDCNWPSDMLALAGAWYAIPEVIRMDLKNSSFLWPFELAWYKPTPGNRIRELEKAGALIAAELDRLLCLKDKKSQKTEQEFFDEFMRLMDFQKKSEFRDSKGFEPKDEHYKEVLALINDMEEAGFGQNHNFNLRFKNYFFKCGNKLSSGKVDTRTFSICIYISGWMELRWG
jgi:hypothetical protein